MWAPTTQKGFNSVERAKGGQGGLRAAQSLPCGAQGPYVRPKGPYVGPRSLPEPPWGPDPGLCGPAQRQGVRAAGAGRAGAGRFAKNLWPLPPHPHTHTLTHPHTHPHTHTHTHTENCYPALREDSACSIDPAFNTICDRI